MSPVKGLFISDCDPRNTLLVGKDAARRGCAKINRKAEILPRSGGSPTCLSVSIWATTNIFSLKREYRMRAKIVCVLIAVAALVIVAIQSHRADTQTLDGVRTSAPDDQDSTRNRVAGKWTYRSFVSDPNLATQFNDLEFGHATLELSIGAASDLSGTLGGPGWQLQLNGKLTPGDAKLDSVPRQRND